MQRPLDSAWILLAVGLGAVGTGLTGLALVAVGEAGLKAVPVALVLAPLILLATVAAVRSAAATRGPLFLMAVGAAWVVVSQIDQHVSEAILVGGVAPEIVHHGAGLVPLAIGASRFRWLTPAPAEG